MSSSNSLHANAPPHHFEQIAKNLQSKRRVGDFSTCDIKLNLKNGFDLVHSMVVCAHSALLADALEPQRAPYQPIDLKEFEGASVKRVIDWMYSGNLNIPESQIADVLAVASYLRVTMLQQQIEQKIRNHSGNPILALNIASVRDFSVMDATMNGLVYDLTDKVAGLTIEEISKLTVNSMIAVMASVLPMQKKVPLINMFILWIMAKKPEKETINTILQSLVISDITFDALYAIRYSLKQYLTNLDIASKSQLSISPSGTIGIKIVTKKTAKQSEKVASSTNVAPPAEPFHRSRSEISAIEHLPDPFNSRSNYRSVSEIEAIKKIPDPFEKSLTSSQSNNSILVRETNTGPKYFTKSEVESLQNMTDPFASSKSEKLLPPISPVYKPSSGFKKPHCTAKYPGWSSDIVLKNKEMERQKMLKASFTASEAQLVRDIPDPFGPSDPVIMSPANGSLNKTFTSGAKQSFSGHSMVNNNYIVKNQVARADRPAILSTMSSASPNVLSSRSEIDPKMMGTRKTESEIREIQALPSFHSASFHTAKTSQYSHTPKGNNDKSQKSQKSDKTLKSQKSQKSQKKLPRSQYLYPN
ncbi:hypothetical protein GCK72_013522 [Caenorhabditis remanei]|uniref:BTB domain-containing protein n=1 Tax=Caenorhabditis remanei TaxID=31234 RepID=A0A6A5GPG1_CAERE|nr:hypothetical protein GCK72_013522 [Caenorhabditis remanei]KAF1757067.1 hypothetical protein GCK72_013522 [Caenorhabditis remanei]